MFSMKSQANNEAQKMQTLKIFYYQDKDNKIRETKQYSDRN